MEKRESAMTMQVFLKGVLLSDPLIPCICRWLFLEWGMTTESGHTKRKFYKDQFRYIDEY